MPEDQAPARRISVLVVDDSAFMRQHIRTILEKDPAFGPVHTARDGVEALQRVHELQPDVVTLDVAMPREDGLGALRRIMAEAPRPCIMLSSLTQEGAPATIEALELGAVDVIGKPSGAISLDIDRYAADITARVKAAARARFRPRRPAPALARPVQAPAVPHAPASALAQWVVVIGVSTGGPRTLAEVLPKLPASLPAAVLIVQHLPASFTRAFAERLDSLSALRVKEAEQGEPIVCGTAYVGPGGIHLGVRRGRLGSSAAIDLLPEPARSVHRPSVDVMMRSALEVFGTRMIGVLLTGMGSDGADAMVAARRAGAKTIAESEESAVIFGMPREAIARGGASIVAPAAAVADEILKILPS